MNAMQKTPWIARCRGWLNAACLAAATAAAALAGGSAHALTPTTTTLSASPNPADPGQPVTLTVNVTGANPTGTVTIQDGTSTLGTPSLVAPDPYWSSVVLLLHCRASDGPHTFRDYSSYAHVHAANGILHDGANSKFGAAPAQWTAAGQYLQYTAAPEFSFGSADFTIETWAYFTSTGGRIIYYGDGGSSGAGPQVNLSRNVGDQNSAVVIDSNGASYAITGSVIPQNTWVHIALVRSGTTLRLFLNGALDGTATLPAGATLATPAGHPTVGRAGDYAGDFGGPYGTSMVGDLVDFRITKGVARYTATFTPPAAAWPDFGGTAYGATLSTSALATGTHSLTASYAGDPNNGASATAAPTTLTINRAPTSTSIAFNPLPAYVHKSVTMTAVVSGATPTGTITFRDGANTLSNQPVNLADPNWSSVSLLLHADGSNGATTFPDATGKNTVTANGAAKVQSAVTRFGSGALQTLSAGASGWLSVPYSPGVVLSSGDFTVEGWLYAVDLPAVKIIMDMASATGYYPWNIWTDGGGHIEFRGFAAAPGGLPAYDILGPVVTANTWHHFAAVRSGSNFMLYFDGALAGTATYAGALFDNSADSLSIGAYGTGTYPFNGYLDEIRITKGVARYLAPFTPPVAPYPEGTATPGASYPTGWATYTTSALSLGTHGITASYSGNPTNQPSATAITNLSVQINPTTVTLTPSASSIGVGNRLQLVAGVIGDNPTGTVTFKDGTLTLGTVALVNGSASLSTSLVTQGTHNLVATYSGDTYNAANPSPATAVTVAKASTTLGLTTGLSSAGNGQPVVLTATLYGGFSTGGTITFFDGTVTGRQIDTVPVVGNSATITTTSLSTSGTHILAATYSGDANNAGSTVDNINLLVEPRSSPKVILKAGPNPTSVGQNVTLTATVNGGNAPTGQIKFFDGSSLLNQISLSGGSASLTVGSLPLGSHALSATYVGDSNNYPADSNLVGIQVDATAPVAPGPMTWTYGYDAEGNPTTTLDPNGNETVTAYDRFQRAFTLTQPRPAPGAASPVVGFDYDGLDQLAKVTDPRGLATRYSTDGLGNTTVLQSPDAGLKGATFDVAGNLLTRTDARGKTTVYAYDPLGRVTSINYASGSPTLLLYDRYTSANDSTAVGHLTQVTDESGATTYRYDGFGHVSRKAQLVGAGTATLSFGVTYTWGSSGPSAGKLTSITYPSGARANYSYDATGRLSGITLNPVNANGVGTNTAVSYGILSGVQYNGANAVKAWTWGDGVAYARGFDAYARLNQYPLGNPAGSGAAAGLVRTLGYDNAGRITAFTHSASGIATPAFDQSFGYDGQDRLTQITKAAGGYFSYGYDANGNRSNRNISGSSYLNTIDPGSNRFTGAQDVGSGGAAVARTYSYDPAGNLTGDGVNTFGYSDRGRMSSAITPGGTVVYKYNGLDQRVKKSGPTSIVSTGAAYYVYDEAGHLLGEYDANGSPVYETVYIGMTPVAVVKQTGSAAAGTLQNSLSYVYADHIATPRVIVRSGDHAIVWRWDGAEAFGATPPDQNPNGLGTFVFDQRMPGQVFDAETGNFDNWYRSYRPGTGSYGSSDPLGLRAGSASTFQYVGGQSTRYVDPSGLMPNPAEATCVEPLQPVCWAGVIADVWSWMTAGAAAGSVVATASISGDTPSADKSSGVSVSRSPVLSPAAAAGAPLCLPNVMLAKPPADAKDPDGPKAPGKPGEEEGFKDPKGGEDWVQNPNGSGYGWRDSKGNVWVPTGKGDLAHGGPHWDVQKPGGGYINVYPGGKRR